MAPKVKKASPKWNVLLAEDDLATRAQLLKTLSKVSRCTTVETGQKALEAYDQAIKNKTPFDFILLDVTMPEIDGFEVLKSIRMSEEANKDPANKNAHIIMITAFKNSLMENYNMGWDDFITKPVDPNMLLKRMQTMAGSI